MSRDASITLVWADGTYTFRLGIGQLRELQEKVDAGPAWVLRRIQSEQWRIDDLREPIRLGLIGGGVKPVDALKLVERYVDPPQPLADSIPFATAVLAAALFGAPDGERPGKQEAAEQAAQTPPSPSAESSASPPSTVPEPF